MNPRRSLLACAVALCLPAHAIEYGWISGDYNSGTFPNPLPAGDVVNASGATSKSFSGLTTIAGLLNWRATANIGMAPGALLRVEGRVNVSTDVGFFPVGVGAGVENLGQFAKSAGSGDFSFNAPLTNRSGGVLDAASGSIVYRAESLFEAASVFTGAGTHRFTSGAPQTYRFAGDFSAPATTLVMEWGNYVNTGASLLAPDASLSWAGGRFVGGWGVRAGHTLTAVSGSAGKVLEGRLDNAGTVDWTGTTTPFGLDDGTVINRNRLLVQDGGFVATGSSGVENEGLFRKAAGPGDFAFNAALLNRAGGVLDAASGRILYRASSSFDAGTLFTGAGQHVFTSGALQTYSFTGDFAASAETTVRLEGGRFVSPAGSVARPFAHLSFAAGTLVGAWTVPAGHTLTAVDPNAGKSFDGRFVNQGDVIWATAGAINNSGSNTTLRNQGRWQVQDGGITTSPGALQFDNTGLFQKTGGTGSFVFRGALANTGTIESLSGTVVLPAGPWRNDGSLRGTARFQASRVDNAGDIAPGVPSAGGPPDAQAASAVAQLSFVGALTQLDSGSLSFDVGPAGLADLLSVSGAVSFGGVARVSPWAGYAPQVGDSFRVMSFGSFSGSLVDVLEIGFDPGVSFEAIYSPQALHLRVTAVPEPASAASLLAGLALLAALRARSRQRPSPRPAQAAVLL